MSHLPQALWADEGPPYAFDGADLALTADHRGLHHASGDHAPAAGPGSGEAEAQSSHQGAGSHPHPQCSISCTLGPQISGISTAPATTTFLWTLGVMLELGSRPNDPDSLSHQLSDLEAAFIGYDMCNHGIDISALYYSS